MKKRNNPLENHPSSNKNNFEETQDKSVTYNLIIAIVVLLILFLESIFILLSSIKKGILKKEVLTKSSNIGFDIVIKT